MTIYIGGIQQLGVGVTDAEQYFHHYKIILGTDARIADESSESPPMKNYTGGRLEQRRAILSLNLNGGGMVELWQYLSRTPLAATQPLHYGDYGILTGKLKSFDIEKSHQFHHEQGLRVSPLVKNPMGKQHYYFQDQAGNCFNVMDYPFDKFLLLQIHPIKSRSGGVCGATLGVQDMERSVRFYHEVLQYDKVLFDEQGQFDDLVCMPGGDLKFRRVILEMESAPQGPFSDLLGRSQIELLQRLDGTGRPIFENRQWGDLGFIHLAFDIQGLDAVKEKCSALGLTFAVDSGEDHQLGDAVARFAVVEDPDGTIIQLIETYQIPLMSEPSLTLDLRKRDPAKPIPKFFLQGLRRSREYS